MTQDDIIDLGHKAGTLFVTEFGVASATMEWLERFAALVAAAEREACAKACDEYDDDSGTGETWGPRFAALIRARSKE